MKDKMNNSEININNSNEKIKFIISKIENEVPKFDLSCKLLKKLLTEI
jgi:hypothetical protein